MNQNDNKYAKGPDANLNKDPISGAVGSHPVGVGVGAVGTATAAGIAGAVIGGPVGAVAGAAVGAVVGGLAGKAAAESVNPTVETKYWQETYSTRPYVKSEFPFEEYAPAYRYGWESYGNKGADAKTFEVAESDLARGWDRAKGTSRLTWENAKHATRDAWNRVQKAAGTRGGDTT